MEGTRNTMQMACFAPFYSTFVTREGLGISRSVSLTRQASSPSWQGKCRTPLRSITLMSSASTVREMLVSNDSLQRIRGINRASELSSTSEIVSALVPIASEDANQQVRYVAISRLSSLDPSSLSEEDKQTLLTAARYILVNDGESSCQAGAADMIAGLRLLAGFDDLISTFNTTSDWMLKFSIAAGMGEMGDPKAFDFLVSVLDTESEESFLLVSAAIGSLGELGDERALPIIERYLNSEEKSIKERAVIAHEMLMKSRNSS